MKNQFYIREIRLDKTKIQQGHYPFSLPVVKHLEKLTINSGVTFFVGENGSGKSTLLEAIAVQYGFNPEGGSINFCFNTNETHSPLYTALSLGKGTEWPENGFFVRAESFYNVATEIERLDKIPSTAPPLLESYGGKSLHQQSHGESFLSLLMNRFSGKGLYLLDEPEAALSPANQMAMLARLNYLVKQGAQFIIATHSPILLAFPGADIFVISENGIVPTDYEQTEHVRLTKYFLNNTQKMLNRLFE